MTFNATPAQVRKTLAGHFNDHQVGTIVELLSQAGIVSVERDKLFAAAVNQNAAVEREARAVARRHGISISASGEINTGEMNARLAPLSTAEKFRCKTIFAQANLIR